MAQTYEFEFDGAMLERGFWLYVWEITPPSGSPLYYVGRTGDSSSPYAQSPFHRVGQHVGHRRASNALRRHLEKREIRAEDCTFRFIAHGPVLPEAPDMPEHRAARDTIAAFEMALCEFITASGADVLNVVRCRRPLDKRAFVPVREAFERALEVRH